MSKKLLEDGTKTWNLVLEKNKQVLWEDLAPEIEEQFKKISCCNTRYLSLEVPVFLYIVDVQLKIFLLITYKTSCID